MWYLFARMFTLSQKHSSQSWKVITEKQKRENNKRCKPVRLCTTEHHRQEGNSKTKANLYAVKQARVFVYLGMFEECCIFLLITGKLKPELNSEGMWQQIGESFGIRTMLGLVFFYSLNQHFKHLILLNCVMKMEQICQTAASVPHGDCFCVLGRGHDLSISHHQTAERLSFYCLRSLLICSVMAVAASLGDDSNPEKKEVGQTNIYPLSLKAHILRVPCQNCYESCGTWVLTWLEGRAELL